MDPEIRFDGARNLETSSKKGPHTDFSNNKLRAKQFIDKLKLEPIPGVSAYMIDNVFFIETHRGKAKYSWPVSLHQSAEGIKKEVALILQKCKEFQS